MLSPALQFPPLTLSADIISGDFNTNLGEPPALWLLKFLVFLILIIFFSSTPQPSIPMAILQTCHYQKRQHLQNSQFKYDPLGPQPVIPSSFCHRAPFHSSPAFPQLSHCYGLCLISLFSCHYWYLLFPLMSNQTSSPANFISKLYSLIYYSPLYPYVSLTI